MLREYSLMIYNPATEVTDIIISKIAVNTFTEAKPNQLQMHDKTESVVHVNDRRLGNSVHESAA